jgi:hypothetical protein
MAPVTVAKFQDGPVTIHIEWLGADAHRVSLYKEGEVFHTVDCDNIAWAFAEVWAVSAYECSKNDIAPKEVEIKML